MQTETGYAFAAVILIPLAVMLSYWTGWNAFLVWFASLPICVPPVYGVIAIVSGRIWAWRNPEEAAKAAARHPRNAVDVTTK